MLLVAQFQKSGVIYLSVEPVPDCLIALLKTVAKIIVFGKKIRFQKFQNQNVFQVILSNFDFLNPGPPTPHPQSADFTGFEFYWSLTNKKLCWNHGLPKLPKSAILKKFIAFEKFQKQNVFRDILINFHFFTIFGW